MNIRPANWSECFNARPQPDDDSAANEEVSNPLSPLDEPEEPSDLEDIDVPCTDEDSQWDVFIPDDDQFDPLPDPGDFWATQD